MQWEDDVEGDTCEHLRLKFPASDLFHPVSSLGPENMRRAGSETLRGGGPGEGLESAVVKVDVHDEGHRAIEVGVFLGRECVGEAKGRFAETAEQLGCFDGVGVACVGFVFYLFFFFFFFPCGLCSCFLRKS